MEYQNLYQDGGPAPEPTAPPSRKPASRTRRIAVSVAAAAVLFGGGAAAGIAMTGGAAAATGDSAAAQQHTAAARCDRLAAGVLGTGHPAAARRIKALCRYPLLRLAAIGGLHGSVTFKAKGGTRTLAFERGTVTSVTGSVLTVRAADGTTWAWAIVPATAVRQGGGKVARSTLADGDQILVAGPVVSGTRDARLIRIRSGG
jgi:hypothetical protein